jgi:hypothetical protein
MTKLVIFDNLGLFLMITDSQTYRRDSSNKCVEAFRVKYLTMPNRITFGATTVIRGYGIRHTCMLKAPDLLLIKLFHTPVTYIAIVSM